MTIRTLTLEQEHWLLSKVKPCPEVVVLAYAGTSFKEWKLIAMCSKEEAKGKDWEAIAVGKYLSSVVVRSFVLLDDGGELNELAGIKTYSVTELRTVAADDRHAVRDEALRRHNLAAKKLAKLQKEVAELETLLKEVM